MVQKEASKAKYFKNSNRNMMNDVKYKEVRLE